MERLLPITITLTEQTRRGKITEVRHCVMPLSEASLNRMMEHGKTGMVILSANRSAIDSDNPDNSLRPEFESWCKRKKIEEPDEEMENEWLRQRNVRADRELKRDIIEVGWSFSPVYGGYKGTDGVTDEFEPSFVVYNYDRKGNGKENFDELKQFAIDMCGKYHQDSVYVQAPNEPPVYLNARGEQVNDSSTLNFKFNRENEPYFTTTKRDKDNPQRFTGDIVFENMYHKLRPADYNERLRRGIQGEFIL